MPNNIRLILSFLTLLLAFSAQETPAQERRQSSEVTFQCPYGYHWNGEKCERLKLPKNAYFNKNAEAGWSCKRGFLPLETRCVPAHLHPKAKSAPEPTHQLSADTYISRPIPSPIVRRKIGSTVEITSHGPAVDYPEGTPPPLGVAENGSYYGQISDETGRPKTVHVQGYTRQDGTYVQEHYRSPPDRQ